MYAAYAAGLRQLALQRAQELAAGATPGGATDVSVASSEAGSSPASALPPPPPSSSGSPGSGTGYAGAVMLLRQASGVYGFLAADLLPRLGGMAAAAAESQSSGRVPRGAGGAGRGKGGAAEGETVVMMTRVGAGKSALVILLGRVGGG